MTLIFSICYLCENKVPEQLNGSEPCQRCKNDEPREDKIDGSSEDYNVPMDINGVPYSHYEGATGTDADAYDEEAEREEDEKAFREAYDGGY
jgi:hypothetical protein